MKLIDEWKATLLKAWSLWLAYAAVALTVLQELLPQIQEMLPVLQPYLSPALFHWLTIGCLVGIPVTRIIEQASLRKPGAAP